MITALWYNKSRQRMIWTHMYHIRKSYRHLPRIKHSHLIHMTCLWLCQAKYITVVFNALYRRHMIILFVYLHGFLHMYIPYKYPRYFYICIFHINIHGIFIYVYTYITPMFFTLIYTYVSPPIYTYVHIRIFTYIDILFQAIIYWPPACSRFAIN